MGTSGLLVKERGGPLGPQTQSLTVLVQLLHLGPSVVIATSWGTWAPRECPARLANTGLWGAPPASPGLGSQSPGTLAFRSCCLSSCQQGWEAGAGCLRTWEWVVGLSLPFLPWVTFPASPLQHPREAVQCPQAPRRNGVKS